MIEDHNPIILELVIEFIGGDDVGLGSIMVVKLENLLEHFFIFRIIKFLQEGLLSFNGFSGLHIVLDFQIDVFLGEFQSFSSANHIVLNTVM